MNLIIEQVPNKIDCDFNDGSITCYVVCDTPSCYRYEHNSLKQIPVTLYGIYDLDEPNFHIRYLQSGFPHFESKEEAVKYLKLKAFW